jgi:hypothetical protein
VSFSLFRRLELRVRESRAALALRPIPLPDAYARHQGDWNGRPLTMTTDVFEGGGMSLRMARVESGGAMESSTMLFLPPVGSGHAIFGADLVSFSGVLGAVIFDVTPKAPVPPRPALALAKRRLLDSGTRRDFSDPDSVSLFSEEAVFVKPHPESESDVVTAFEAYLEAFETSVAAPISPEEAAASEDRYLKRLSSVKRQGQVLAKLFGKEFVEDYFSTVFCASRVTTKSQTERA